MHRGYTKRWRKRWDKGYHQDALLWVMMDYFIDFAAWQDKEFAFVWRGRLQEMVKLRRGQCFFTYKGLADFLTGPKNKVSRKMVRDRVEILKKIEFLGHQEGHKYQIVTILNYSRYNTQETDEGHQEGTSRERVGNEQGTSRDTTNNYKEYKEYKKYNKSENIRRRPDSPPEVVAVNSPDYHAIITEAIKYLNHQANVSFNPATYATETLMVERINEGYTLDDFKKVIKTKSSQWLNDERMAGNLAPTTLFASDKFEKYLQEANRNGGSQKPKAPKPTANELLALGYDILDKFGSDKFKEFCRNNELSVNDVNSIQEKYDREHVTN